MNKTIAVKIRGLCNLGAILGNKLLPDEIIVICNGCENICS
jgi:hypothetical protein